MKVYQNKLLPYKAEQFLLAGFDTPSSYQILLNAQIHAVRSIIWAFADIHIVFLSSALFWRTLWINFAYTL